jgi:hypothetical protein
LRFIDVGAPSSNQVENLEKQLRQLKQQVAQQKQSEIKKANERAWNRITSQFDSLATDTKTEGYFSSIRLNSFDFFIIE